MHFQQWSQYFRPHLFNILIEWVTVHLLSNTSLCYLFIPKSYAILLYSQRTDTDTHVLILTFLQRIQAKQNTARCADPLFTNTRQPRGYAVWSGCSRSGNKEWTDLTVNCGSALPKTLVCRGSGRINIPSVYGWKEGH